MSTKATVGRKLDGTRLQDSEPEDNEPELNRNHETFGDELCYKSDKDARIAFINVNSFPRDNRHQRERL